MRLRLLRRKTERFEQATPSAYPRQKRGGQVGAQVIADEDVVVTGDRGHGGSAQIQRVGGAELLSFQLACVVLWLSHSGQIKFVEEVSWDDIERVDIDKQSEEEKEEGGAEPFMKEHEDKDCHSDREERLSMKKIVMKIRKVGEDELLE
jgi:hypothetical protein